MPPKKSYSSPRRGPKEIVPVAQVLACPNMITEPTHHLKNGNCRCFDPKATEMAAAGYEWQAVCWRRKL